MTLKDERIKYSSINRRIVIYTSYITFLMESDVLCLQEGCHTRMIIQTDETSDLLGDSIVPHGKAFVTYYCDECEVWYLECKVCRSRSSTNGKKVWCRFLGYNKRSGDLNHYRIPPMNVMKNHEKYNGVSHRMTCDEIDTSGLFAGEPPYSIEILSEDTMKLYDRDFLYAMSVPSYYTGDMNLFHTSPTDHEEDFPMGASGRERHYWKCDECDSFYNIRKEY